MDSRLRKVRFRLGGVRLFLYLLCFYRQKIMFFPRYYTIAARRKFRGQEVPYTLEPGWIIGWRYDAKGRKVYFHVRSIYELVRSYGHALISEEVARGNAEVSIETAMEIVRDLLAFWPLTDELRRRLTLKLNELQERFSRAQKETLAQAADQVERAVGFRDRRERPNPGVSAAHITAARSRLSVRLSEIMDIVSNLNRLLVVTEQEIARIGHLLLTRDFALLREIQRAIPQCCSEDRIKWMIATLRYVRDDLDTIQVAPFWRNCRYLEADIGKALQLLINSGQTPQARAQAIASTISTMLYSLGFKRAQRELEGLIKELSMRLAAKQMTEAQAEKLAQKLTGFAGRIVRLREDGFKHQRLSAVTETLTRAIERLRAGQYDEAKQAMKTASARL